MVTVKSCCLETGFIARPSYLYGMNSHAQCILSSDEGNTPLDKMEAKPCTPFRVYPIVSYSASYM